MVDDERAGGSQGTPPAAPPDQGEPPRRQPGFPQVLALGAIVVAITLAVAWITSELAPTRSALDAQPLIILVLIVGTAFVLWRITRPAPRG